MAVGYDELRRILDADGVVVEPGDMVCLHTGFAERLLGMNRNPDPAIVHDLCAGLDGRDRRLLNWITDSGLCALIADNYAVEVHPPCRGTAAARRCRSTSIACSASGSISANCGTSPRSPPGCGRTGASAFLTAPPLRLPGAVGSPTTPIATV